jgi:hypothetical protein
MIRNLLALALLAPLAASAQQVSPEKQRDCLLKGAVFQQAAAYRDQGLPPAYALKATMAQGGVTQDFAKKAINLVYFDPGFVGAGGDALMQQMAQVCMHPHGLYKPLQ